MEINNVNGWSYYLFADKHFYEPMDYCAVKENDYLEYVRSKLDAGWKLIRSGIWINCIHLKQDMPVQGWKIHLSTTPTDSIKLSRVVAEYLIQQKVSFKFLLDKKTLGITNSKAWSRGGSGKFMTIYPADAAQFKRLLEELHSLTGMFCGPYILSDKRYKDSKVLYYRYGGIRPNFRLDVAGHSIPVLVSPEGKEIRDVRTPYYQLPAWVEEIFPEKDRAAAAGLNNGRYNVEKAIHFSNTGGVYIANDNIVNRKLLIKEARAHVHAVAESVDAIDMLTKEYAVLKKIEDCGIAPKPVELFKEWEHLFLVEEYLENYVSLRSYAAQDSILFETQPTGEKVKSYLERYLSIFKRLAEIVDVLHSQNIIFGDFSANNVLINPTTLDIKIIDLEGAHIEGVGESCNIYTPGFASVSQVNGAKPTRENDYYSFGAIMLYMLTHFNDVLELKPEVKKEILKTVSRDFGLPAELKRIIDNLMHPDPARRGKPSVLLNGEHNTGLKRVGVIKLAAETPAQSRRSILNMAREAGRFVESSADYKRKDRLFPADPDVFETNPLSLAHGALGVAYALVKLGKKPVPGMMKWIRQHKVSSRNYAPGLSIGMSGIAWGLLELGDVSGAESVFKETFENRLLPMSASLYTGLAGWGMTNLKFWLTTGKDVYLDNAKKAGEMLEGCAHQATNGLCWPDPDGGTQLGLAHGASGIGLFLLYLHSATGNEKYKKMAVAALDYDISYAVDTDNGGLTWSKKSGANDILYPYLEYGSAGMGISCLRYLKKLKDVKYLNLVNKIHIDCDRKYTIFPGRNNGLAGIGEFMLDAFDITKDKKHLGGAYRVASGIKLFAIQSKKGIAFPGNGLARISCDYATGVSGIMLFLDRLVTGRPADFMLDELL